MSIYLKDAAETDCGLLFKWANDRETRENSFSNKEIPYEEHVKWFNDKLSSQNSQILIMYEDETPVGQVRIEIKNEKAVISYSIDKNHRGKGYGVKILELLEEEVKNRMPFIKKLVGYVKFGNIPSKKIFYKLGYTEVEKEKWLEYYKEL